MIVYVLAESPAHNYEDLLLHCAYACHYDNFKDRSIGIAGISSQRPNEQLATPSEPRIPDLLLSDPELRLSGTAGVSPVCDAHRKVFTRFTLIPKAGTIEHAVPPSRDVADEPDRALNWPRSNGAYHQEQAAG